MHESLAVELNRGSAYQAACNSGESKVSTRTAAEKGKNADTIKMKSVYRAANNQNCSHCIAKSHLSENRDIAMPALREGLVAP